RSAGPRPSGSCTGPSAARSCGSACGRRSGGPRLFLALVLVGVAIAGLVEAVGLRLRDDEAAHPEALLHLVERLLAEVAHPEKVVVLELQQLADLDDVVALERVVRPHREIELLDRHVEHGRRQRPDTW